MKKLTVIILLIAFFMLSGCMNSGDQQKDVKREENKQREKVSKEQKEKEEKGNGEKKTKSISKKEDGKNEEDKQQEKVSKEPKEKEEKENGKKKTSSISKEEFLKAAEEGEKKIVKNYINNGGNVNVRNKGGNTALIEAIKGGNNEIAKLLIENGADVNVKGDNGRPALMVASGEGSKEIVKLLIENGADINAKNDISGFTALMHASNKGNKEIVKILIENGADINAKDKYGTKALMHSSTKEVAELLYKKGSHSLNISNPIKKMTINDNGQKRCIGFPTKHGIVGANRSGEGGQCPVIDLKHYYGNNKERLIASGINTRGRGDCIYPIASKTGKNLVKVNHRKGPLGMFIYNLKEKEKKFFYRHGEIHGPRGKELAIKNGKEKLKLNGIVKGSNNSSFSRYKGLKYSYKNKKTKVHNTGFVYNFPKKTFIYRKNQGRSTLKFVKSDIDIRKNTLSVKDPMVSIKYNINDLDNPIFEKQKGCTNANVDLYVSRKEENIYSTEVDLGEEYNNKERLKKDKIYSIAGYGFHGNNLRVFSNGEEEGYEPKSYERGYFRYNIASKYDNLKEGKNNYEVAVYGEDGNEICSKTVSLVVK